MKYFGTDGIRRIANTELTPGFVYKVAKAGAYVLSKHADGRPINIIIGSPQLFIQAKSPLVNR